MTIRRRIKQKWHSSKGDFDFKKASYNPNGTKSFEVWYKKFLVGECSNRSLRRRNNKNDTSVSTLEIYNFVAKIGVFQEVKTLVGRVYCRGNKNGFPEEIVSAELFPKALDIVETRTVMIEKYIFRNFQV